jgi:hypothetical protein
MESVGKGEEERQRMGMGGEDYEWGSMSESEPEDEGVEEEIQLAQSWEDEESLESDPCDVGLGSPAHGKR